MENPPKLREYDGKGDSDKHMHLVNDLLNYFDADKASKGKLFAFTLVGPAKFWFNGLSDMRNGS